MHHLNNTITHISFIVYTSPYYFTSAYLGATSSLWDDIPSFDDLGRVHMVVGLSKIYKLIELSSEEELQPEEEPEPMEELEVELELVNAPEIEEQEVEHKAKDPELKMTDNSFDSREEANDESDINYDSCQDSRS